MITEIEVERSKYRLGYTDTYMEFTTEIDLEPLCHDASEDTEASRIVAAAGFPDIVV